MHPLAGVYAPIMQMITTFILFCFLLAPESPQSNEHIAGLQRYFKSYKWRL